MKERRWARESSPQRAQRGSEAEGSADTPARNDERLATLYEYDPATLQLAKSTATDGEKRQGLFHELMPMRAMKGDGVVSLTGQWEWAVFANR